MPPSTMHLGLRHLLAAHADRAERDLPRGDVGRLVGLGVRPQAHAGVAREVGHALQIALEGVEIDEEGRRVDLGQRHADGGGRRHGTCVHSPIDLSSAATPCLGKTAHRFFFASSAANVPPSAASFSISGAIFQRAPYLAS